MSSKSNEATRQRWQLFPPMRPTRKAASIDDYNVEDFKIMDKSRTMRSK